ALPVAALPPLHDRPGAEGLLDLADRVIQRLLLGRRRRRLRLRPALLPGHGFPLPRRGSVHKETKVKSSPPAVKVSPTAASRPVWPGTAGHTAAPRGPSSRNR